jgi:hypothetical protein
MRRGQCNIWLQWPVVTKISEFPWETIADEDIQNEIIHFIPVLLLRVSLCHGMADFVNLSTKSGTAEYIYMNMKRGLLLWREEHELLFYENKVLRKISSPKKDKESDRFQILHK